jgi:hypothetical protein
MSRICGAPVLAVALLVALAAAGAAAKVTNAYETATATTQSGGVEVAVDIAAAHQDPGAGPFDVEVICVDASGMFKRLLALNSGGQAAISMLGRWRSASYYGASSEVVPGISFSLFLPPRLVDLGDRPSARSIPMRSPLSVPLSLWRSTRTPPSRCAWTPSGWLSRRTRTAISSQWPPT